MVKRWLARVEQKSVVLRRSVIGVLSLTAVVGAVYLSKPLLWSGGFGIGKDQAVTTESVEIDARGNITKTVKMTKYDDGKTLWDWLSLLGVPVSLAILGFLLQQNQQKRSERVAKEQKNRDEIFAEMQKDRDENFAKELREIAAAETKEEILQTYFDRLSLLLVDNNLLAIASKVHATETDETEGQQKNEATLEERELFNSSVNVIRARTLSILRRFENDPERKSSVIRFLIEADIISKVKLNLSDADLSGAKLREANLSGAILNKAILIDVDLSSANLNKAQLNEANLNEAHLNDAELNEASLRYAELNGAYLYSANMKEANLTRAKLNGANLNKAKLNRANLYDASLNDANLSEAHLSSASLVLAHMQKAFLVNAYLDKANLERADLSSANLSGADLSGADLNGANLSLACLERTNLYGANLNLAILEYARFCNNDGLSKSDKADMEKRRAIFFND
jgi:uncharacterized protein YjbI with pentapeptide repeats